MGDTDGALAVRIVHRVKLFRLLLAQVAVEPLGRERVRIGRAGGDRG